MREATKPGGRPGRRGTSGYSAAGAIAEGLGRWWLGIGLDRRYTVLSAARFVEDLTVEETKAKVREMSAGAVPRLQVLLPQSTDPNQNG
ncbi:MAG: hypothetical protein COZ05_20885 [Armatimonadetes bacterium CG_4_10_14_3_um_filter_59_10]|nr:MAG: hypothetical protein COZ05_20885 [Armatimonadetes bacterium CG_4_10_14_3_um_filter_59_10]